MEIVRRGGQVHVHKNVGSIGSGSGSENGNGNSLYKRRKLVDINTVYRSRRGQKVDQIRMGIQNGFPRNS
jgi:hypothetical protein